MTTDLTLTCRAPVVAYQMAEAASSFLSSLSPEQRIAANFPFEDQERYTWHYTPVERTGLRLKDMTSAQREAAFALADSGLSARGAHTIRQIIALEPILREVEREAEIDSYSVRDPELYYFSVFGEPGGSRPWGWRVGGHHVGLHFTVVESKLIAPTPLFFGANPAEVKQGTSKGLRTLPLEEDLARTLLTSMEPSQRRVVIVDSVAPDDILTKNYRMANPDTSPVGIRYTDMSGEQRELLVRLVQHYVERTADDLAGNAWTRIERAGLEAISFAWAGPEERGKGHYYAVKGPNFLIEYDNTQNGANHIHSVWRDFTNDWGEDLLAVHYAIHHQR